MRWQLANADCIAKPDTIQVAYNLLSIHKLFLQNYIIYLVIKRNGFSIYNTITDLFN